MSSFFFWKSWAKEYRYTWFVAAVFFLLSLVFMWNSWFKGPDGVTDWVTLQEQKILDIDVHSFRLGPFEIKVPAESYVIFEYFNASRISPDLTSSYLFLGITAVSIVLMLGIISTLDKFWYYFGMGLFIIFVVTLRFEVIGLLGNYNRILVSAGVLALYVVPSFIFNQFRPATPFVIRLIVFATVTIILVAAIKLLSTVEYPFYHLYLTSFTGTLVISMLFIILVAHEIIAGFVYMVTQGTSKSLFHLLIISLIYLGNLFITALYLLRAIQWDFIYINAFLLITLSAVLGIWGFKNRENRYGNILPFYPFGAIFFLAIGAICFATAGQLLANYNDPGIKIFRDLIVYSHFGYGLIFIFYLLSNFGQLMADNRPVYKVMYEPKRMPYFSFRLAGLVATLVFVFFGNWRDVVSHSFAAFYNSAGDLHTLLQNKPFAESFYTQSFKQGFQNYRANYVLAGIKGSRFDIANAHYHYRLANSKGATEYSLVNAANLHLWKNDHFSAVKAYRKGLEIMPNSSLLANNAGVSYAKLHVIDSAAMLLNSARDSKQSRKTAEMNFFALAAAEFIPINADSVLRTFNTKSTGTISNALALSTVLKIPFTYEVNPLENKKLDLYSATLLNNYIIYHAKAVDTVFINEAYRIASDPANEPYSETLKSSLAFAYYHEGNIARALEILAEQVYVSQSYQGKFNYIMGLWALEQNNPELASTYFTYAHTYDYRDARFYNAIALTETGRVDAALAAWDTVGAYGDDPQKEIGARIRRILTLPSAEAITLSDGEKYQFCRYRLSIADSAYFNRLSNTFNNANYKAQALLDFSRKCFEAGYVIPAIRHYQRIAGLKLTNKDLYEEARHFELRMLASRGEMRELASVINKGIDFSPARNLEKIYYTALVQDSNGDTVAAAKNYRILASYNPYFEEGILAAYNFFRRRSETGFEPYNIVAEAIQVNANSLRLLRVYRDEAMRLGLEQYATETDERIRQLENFQTRRRN
jgi:Flp pilus assembly protein TadD